MIRKIQNLFKSTLLLNIILCILYIVAAKLSLRLAFVNASTTAVWPPTGIAIAAILLLGKRVAPAIFVGAFLSNVTTSGTIITSLFIALGNTLEGYIGAWLVQKLTRSASVFTSPRNAVMFAVSVCCAAFVSATVGVTTLSLASFSPWSMYPNAWLTWALGDITGAMIVVPFILLWFSSNKKIKLAKLLEILLFTAVFLFVCHLVFFGIFPQPYIVIPLLLWSIFRFEPRETARFVLILSGIGIWATLGSVGPFAMMGQTPNQSLLLLQLFVATVSLTMMTVAGLVSEWRDAKQKMTHSERLFRALIEKSSDAVSLIDTNANILYASPSTREILGYTPEEFVGMPGFSIVHPEDLDRIMKLLSGLVATPNETITATFRIKRKDDTWIWVEAMTTNLLHDPAVKALVVNYRDITDRKKLEESKNEFMMIAAHQLRTPLATMRWTMELLLKASTKLPAAIKEKLTTLFENNQKMIDLTNSFLDSTRIVQGKIIYQPKPTDIGPIIQKALDVYIALAAKNGITMKVKDAKDTIPTISIDPARFDEVLQNILSNALKYTNKQGIITVSVNIDADVIHIVVTDTGIGIPLAEQSKLFTKFYRTTNARVLVPEGSGLGLFTAQNYAQRWGGSIIITSPTLPGGKGTSVDVTIPLSLVYKPVTKGGTV